MRLCDVEITDAFFKTYYDLVVNEMMPYQWDALNDNVPGAEKSHAIENIKIAAGVSDGDFYGRLFQDSDFAKWLEALGYCLQKGDLREFEKDADDVIGYIEKAQQPDGYFNTYFQLAAADRKFTNLYEAHELYCAGHFIEAATSYYEAMGKKTALDIACRLADMIDARFGTEEGKLRGYPGHQEIELALIKLYETTKAEKYLKLACYFLDERGKEPHFFRAEHEKRDGYSEYRQGRQELPDDFTYNQAHMPVREQEEAVGHAVRAVYMYTAMAEAARLTGDAELLLACEKLFDNIILKQMYLNGSIGSTSSGEAFTFDYDLPNSINYSETCASIGLIFFAHSMLKMKKDSRYSDTIELALYNTVLASIQTDGKSYLYVNPMETVPEASNRNPDKAHVKTVRQPWYGCACCPPNIARLLSSLEKYIYSFEDGVVYVHQYISSKATFNAQEGKPSDRISVEMQSSMPNSGDVIIHINEGPATVVAVRLPDWSRITRFTLNGAPVEPEFKDGYAYIRTNGGGDVVGAYFSLTVDFIHARTAVRDASGKTAIKRGPLVYCLEETDNMANLHRLVVAKNGKLGLKKSSIAGIEYVAVLSDGFAESDADGNLYTYAEKRKERVQLEFVPYFLWGNREHGEMLCWVREE